MGDAVKVGVAAENRVAVLASEGRDPGIVAGDGLAGGMQVQADLGILFAGLCSDRKKTAPLHEFFKPLLIASTISGTANPVSVFTKYDHRKGDLRGLG